MSDFQKGFTCETFTYDDMMTYKNELRRKSTLEGKEYRANRSLTSDLMSKKEKLDFSFSFFYVPGTYSYD